MKQSTYGQLPGQSEMARSNLSIPHRVALMNAGLLSRADIEGLIMDALTQNMTHYLPRDLREYSAAMVKAGKIILPES